MGTKVEIQRNYGERGQGSIADQGNFYLVTFANGKQFNIPKQDGVAEWTDVFFGDNLFVELRYDNAQIKYVRPWAGNYVGRFLRFTSTDEGPKTKPGYWGTNRQTGKQFWVEPKEKFTAVFEIVSGQYKGAQLISSYEYLIGADHDGTIKFAGWKKALEELVQFLQTAGYDPNVDSLPYSQNVLPALEKFLVEQDKIFLIKVNEGWVETLSDYGDGVPMPEDIKPRPQPETTEPVAQTQTPATPPAQESPFTPTTPPDTPLQQAGAEATERLFGSGQPTL